MALRSVWLGVCNPSKGSVAIIGISNVIPATILPPVAYIGKAREKQAASVVVDCGNYVDRRWVLYTGVRNIHFSVRATSFYEGLVFFGNIKGSSDQELG
jgi:hypothetical protein